jgi:hypothetical protein
VTDRFDGMSCCRCGQTPEDEDDTGLPSWVVLVEDEPYDEHAVCGDCVSPEERQAMDEAKP